MSVFSRKIGIDLGSAYTRIIIPKRGIVLEEPSIVARSAVSGKIIAVGNAALEMAGKTPESTITQYPLQRGVIADFGATATMLRRFLAQSVGRFHIVKPELMISVSMTATSTEQRAVVEAGESAGAQEVHIIQPPVAAALGARVTITEPRGNMIVDIGAGTTEVAVMSLGGIVSKRAIRTGGNTINELLLSQLRRRHGIVVGQGTIEQLKRRIGHIGTSILIESGSMTISGRSTVEGLPKSITLSSTDTHQMIQPAFEEIVRTIRSVIEQTPPELVADIKKNGILLSGGGARLSGLETYLSERLNTSCGLVEKPSQAVARGTKLALTHLEEYQKSLLSI